MTYRIFEDGRRELRHDETITIESRGGQFVVWICDIGEDNAFAFDTHEEARAFAAEHFATSPSATGIEDRIAEAAWIAEKEADRVDLEEGDAVALGFP